MKRTIILIGHKQRQGKDTFAEMLAKHTGGEIIRFADPMKHIIADTFNISLDDLEGWKNNKKFLMHHDDIMQPYRDVLQRFGTEAMKKQFGSDVWGQLAGMKIDSIDNKVIIIPDFRFTIELAALKDYLIMKEIITVNVVRPGMETNDTHASEVELDNFEYDILVKNDGTLHDLEEVAVKTLMLIRELRS